MSSTHLDLVIPGKVADPTAYQAGKLLQTAAYALESFCDLFSSCISEGKYPDVWKNAVIKSIP